MRVPTSNYTSSLLSDLSRLTQQQQTLQTQLSTGLNIQKVSDDSALANQVIDDQTSLQRLEHYQDTATQAKTYVELSTNNVDYLKDLSETVVQLAEQAGDDTTGLTGKLDQILEEALNVANEKVGDGYLHGGTSDSEPFAVTEDADGNITAISYTANSSGRSLEVADGTRVSPFTTESDHASIETFLNGIVALRDAISAGDSTAMDTAIGTLEDSEDAFVDIEGDLSLTDYRIEMSQERNQTKMDTYESRISDDIAVDTTEATVSLLNVQSAYQGSLQAASTIMGMDILDFI